MQPLALGIDIGLLVTGAIIAGGWLLVCVARARDPLRGSPLRPNRIGPVAVWICIAAYLMGASAGGSLGHRLAPAGAGEEARQLWEGTIGTSIGGVCAIVACLLVGRLSFRAGWRVFGLGRRSVLRDVLTAVPACIAAIALTTGVAWVTERLMRLLIRGFKPPEHSVLTILHDRQMPRSMRDLAFLGALIVAPLSEELLFRGVLQSAIRRLIPPQPRSMRHRWIAIGIVAALFGSMHYSTPQHVPALILFGAMLGYLYERTGSLLLPILVHMMFNAKSLLWEILLR